MSDTSEFVTRNEFETRMNYHEKILDEIHDETHQDVMKIRSDVIEIRSYIKEIGEKLDAMLKKFGWFLILWGVALVIAFCVTKKF